jgi:hypothetical protein
MRAMKGETKMKDKTEEMVRDNILATSDSISLSIDDSIVRLNFTSNSDNHVLEEIKHMILNGFCTFAKSFYV